MAREANPCGHRTRLSKPRLGRTPLSGQLLGHIDEIKRAADSVRDTVSGFYDAVGELTAENS